MTPKHLNLYTWYPHREMNGAWFGRRLLCINWDIFRVIPIIKLNKTRNPAVWGLTGLRKPPNKKVAKSRTCLHQWNEELLPRVPWNNFYIGVIFVLCRSGWSRLDTMENDYYGHGPNGFGWTRLIGNTINNNNQIWESITFQHESIPYKTPPRTPGARMVVTNICVGIH